MQEPFEIEFELEEDGRWIAEAVDLPGVLTYGATRAEAQAKVKTLTCEVLKNLSVQG
jgi:predicted RNase H-like HicB family nuclease